MSANVLDMAIGSLEGKFFVQLQAKARRRRFNQSYYRPRHSNCRREKAAVMEW